MSEPVYLDTSALVKLVLAEDGSESLERFMTGGYDAVSSELSEIELTRAVLRRVPERLSTALDVLSNTFLLPITTSVRRDASRLKPSGVTTLDAIQLATAIGIQGDLSYFVCYDNRLNVAAKDVGLPVMAPGRTA
jgi:uncharacterized protein